MWWSSVSSKTSRPPSMLLPLPLLAYLFLFPVLVSSGDVYVDDKDDAVSYAGDSWAGNGCNGCSASPDASQTYGSSWHQSTYVSASTDSSDSSSSATSNGGWGGWGGQGGRIGGGGFGGPGGTANAADVAQTITLSFTGVAVSAYFIVPDKTNGDAVVNTNLIFTLDGSEAGTYTHSPSGDSDFLYKQRLFQKSGLSNSAHTLVVSATASSGESSVVLFDNFVYTTQDESSSTGAAASPSASSSGGAATSSRSASSPASSEQRNSSSSSSGTSQTSTNSSSRSSLAAASGGSVTNASSPTSTKGNSASPVTSTGANGELPSGSGSDPSVSEGETGASSHHNNAGIIGGVVGGILGLLLLLFLLFCYRRKAKRAEQTLDVMESPNTMTPTTSSGPRPWYQLRNGASSLLAPHPAVFGGEQSDTRHTDESRLQKSSSTQNLLPLFHNEKRQLHEMSSQSIPVTEPNPDRPTSSVAGRSTTTEGTGGVLTSPAEILSQMAAIQEAVLTLQRQATINGLRLGDDMMMPPLAPPAYERTPAPASETAASEDGKDDSVLDIGRETRPTIG